MEHDVVITIEVIKGGFVLHYPSKVEATADTSSFMRHTRELFTSSRKMNQRIKEVLDALSITPTDSE